MEFETAKEWLDALVDNLEQIKSLDNFNNQIQTTGTLENIHIYSGIEVLSDLMGIKLKARKLSDYKYPYRYYFVYRGIEIFQLSKERIGA